MASALSSFQLLLTLQPPYQQPQPPPHPQANNFIDSTFCSPPNPPFLEILQNIEYNVHVQCPILLCWSMRMKIQWKSKKLSRLKLKSWSSDFYNNKSLSWSVCLGDKNGDWVKPEGGGCWSAHKVHICVHRHKKQVTSISSVMGGGGPANMLPFLVLVFLRFPKAFLSGLIVSNLTFWKVGTFL